MSVLHKIYRDNHCEVKYFVDEDQDGLRLDQFLGVYLESFSRELIKKKIKDKEVIIKDRPGTHKPSSVLHHKDEVTIFYYPQHWEDEYWLGQKLELQKEPEIVFEDEELLVISKPAFMSTHPAGRHLFNCATVFFEMKHQHTIHSLHRIDRETSGILMLGKTPRIATEMMQNFEDEDSIKKCYLFISRIQPEFKHADEFEANERMGPIHEDLRRVYIHAFDQHSKEGKHARTFFFPLIKDQNYLIGIACPQTGRQHQIRVHAKAHGIPLIGDKLYLGSYELFQRFKDQKATQEDHDLMELPRHALHAIALKIPYKKEEKLFISSIPQDFRQWILKNTCFDLDELNKSIKSTVHKYYTQF